MDDEEVDSNAELQKTHTLIDLKEIDRFCDVLTDLMTEMPDLERVKLNRLPTTNAIKGLEEQQIGDLLKAFSVLYGKASMKSIVPIPLAISLVKEHVNADEGIEMHPDFPKMPLTASQILFKDRQISIGEGDLLNFDDSIVKRKYEDLASKEIQDYVQKMKNFRKKQKGGLNRQQILFIDDRIKTYEKKILSNEPVPKKLKLESPKKKEPKSAFEFFKLSKCESYADYEPEKRERKLLKKYNKLPEETRQIFEGLAKSQK